MISKNEIIIKKLTGDDILQMRQMLILFGEAFEQKEIYCGDQPTDKYLIKLLNENYFIALAAVNKNNVVGGLAAYELKKFEQQRSEIYIYDLAVDEKFRRQGIAGNLINKLKEEAVKRNAYVIFVQADYEDPPAIHLYEKFGTKEEILHFDIDPVKITNDKK